MTVPKEWLITANSNRGLFPFLLPYTLFRRGFKDVFFCTKLFLWTLFWRVEDKLINPQKLKCVGLSVIIQMVRDQEKISMFTCTCYKMMHENSSAICNGHTQGLSETNRCKRTCSKILTRTREICCSLKQSQSNQSYGWSDSQRSNKTKKKPY